MIILFKKNLTYIIFTLPLLIDTLNGVLRGSDGSDDSLAGILFKGLIILYSIIFTHSLKSKYIGILLILGFICFVIQFILGVFNFSIVTSYIKSIYAFFVLYILIKSPWCKDEFTVYNAAIFYGTGASVVLLCSYFWGWGYTSYVSDSSFGVKGFFIAMNDICLSILLLNCLSLLCYQVTKDKHYVIYSILMSIGNIMTGSIAGVIGTCIVLLLYFSSVFFFPISNYKCSKSEKVIILVSLFFVLFYVGTRVIEVLMADAYLASKYDDLLATFTEMSGRRFLMDASSNVLRGRCIIYDLVGQGEHYLYAVSMALGMEKGLKGAEVDLYDLVGVYGIFLAILIIYYPIKIAVKSFRYYLRGKKSEHYWVLFASLIFIGHSFYGGHAFTSPTAYSYYVPFMFLMIKRRYLIFK